MAKIKLTRRTFADAIAEQLDRSNGFEGMFAKALTGDVVFGIMFTPQAKISEMVWFDGSDFEEFMKTWKGE